MLTQGELIRCRHQEQVINKQFGFMDRHQEKADFLAYFKKMSKGKPQKWDIVYRNFEILFREAIHAIQDGLGHMDGESRSAEKFQEHVLGDFMEFRDLLNGGGGCHLTLDFGLEGDNEGRWQDFLFDCFDEDGNNFNREYFLEHIMEYFDIFQEAHPGVPGYSDPLEDNYQWDWETFLNMLGL